MHANRNSAVFGQRGRAACVAVILAAVTAIPASAIETDFVSPLDPSLDPGKQTETIRRFSSRLLPLWLEALAHPEADLKRQVADAITQAHAQGMPGLAETVPPLLRELEASHAPLVVRLAIARALVALDARQSAEVLMRHALADGFDMARLSEPALAKWNFAPMRTVWLDRLKSSQTPPGLLLLALQAADLAKLNAATPSLRRLSLDHKAEKAVRLEAARSLASLQHTGLEAEASRLADGSGHPNILDRLVAATLLTHHRGAEVEALLLRLAADEEPAVAVVACGRLAEIDPKRLQPLLDRLVTHSDSRLRRLAARVLAELRTPETVTRLGPLLDDPHQEIRAFVGDSLARLEVVPELAESVRQATMRVLNAQGPRGHEQAALVVGAVRYKPAAERLAQLLESRAGEVRVATAWALRRVSVPTTATAILKQLQTLTDEGRRRRTSPDPIPTEFTVRQAGHLIEALGVLRHRPAVPLLKEYLPLPPPPMVQALSRLPANLVWQNSLRATAIWSLGHIYADDPQADLAATFRARLELDRDPVRAAAAVAIGRMKVKALAPVVRPFYENEGEEPVVRLACAWTLERLTGAPVSRPKFPVTVREIGSVGWFLEPLPP